MQSSADYIELSISGTNVHPEQVVQGPAPEATSKSAPCQPTLRGVSLLSGVVAALVVVYFVGFGSSDPSNYVPNYDQPLTDFLIEFEAAAPRRRQPPLSGRFFNLEMLGVGYNMFQGNPLEPGASQDRGLQTGHPIFNIRNENTPGVSVLPMDRCEEEYGSNAVYGMSSYRNEIENSVGMSASYGGLFLAGAFSMSTSWGTVEAATTTRNSVIVESVATCSVYSAHIVERTPWDREWAPLTDSFKAALDWLASDSPSHTQALFQLIDFYGTHAIFDGLLMGSMSGTRSELTEEGYLSFRQDSHSLETAASVSSMVASFGVSGSTASEREQAEEFNTARSRTWSYTIGTQPRSGHWGLQTRPNPAPIQFNLLDLSAVIRNYSERPELADRMQTALQSYCQELRMRGKRVTCTDPLPDQIPVPSPPARFRSCLRSTIGYGGSGGGDFGNSLTPSQGWVWASSARLTSIAVRAGSRLDSIQFNMAAGSGNDVFQSTTAGGGGGGSRTINVPSNSRIVGVNLRSGRNVDGLQFVYSNGQASDYHGGGGGGAHNVRFSGLNARLVGFHGRAGARVDRLGFFWMYEVQEGQSC